jgi:hypothetical protein
VNSNQNEQTQEQAPAQAPEETIKAGDIPKEIIMRDIQRQQRNKLRNTSTYSPEELKSAINGEFGSAKLTIPREILMGSPQDGLSLEERASAAIGSYFGPTKVTYVNKKSRIDSEPTGQVSIRIGMLSPAGAERLARGYKMWPGEKQPRGFYVDLTHVIEANSIITLPMYTNSWRVTWRSLPSGILSDGAVREHFYLKMPSLLREAILELEANQNHIMRLDPATGEEMEQEGGITLIQYWDQWAKQEKWTLRYFPPYTIDSGPGYDTSTSHSGRRPNYKDAKFDPAAIRLEFPPAFRSCMKKAAEKAAKAIGGEGWEVRFRGYVYPEPSLSTLNRFPITIVQSKKKPTPVLDPRKTAVRVVVTPRRKLPEGETLITHPVEIGRWIEDTQDVSVVAIAREAPIPVSLPAEKIEASVYVYYVVLESLMPHKQLQLAEPSNQSFTRRISLWNASDARDKVKMNKEIFSVSRELACLPQEMAEEVKEVTSQDTMRSMMQSNFKSAMEMGREESGATRSITDKAATMFALDAKARNADIDDQVRILQKAENERQQRTDQAMADMMEDLERQKAHKKIQDDKIAERAAKAAQDSQLSPTQPNNQPPHQKNTEPFLHIQLMPSNRTSLITVTSMISVEGTPPNLMDLARYVVQSMEMGPNVGCSNESIEKWTTKHKKEQAPIKMQIKLGQGSDTRTYEIPDHAQAASLIPLMPLFTAQGMTPGANSIKIVAKVLKAAQKINKNHPAWMYAKPAPEEEWSISPAQKRSARRDSGADLTPTVAKGNIFDALADNTQPHEAKQSKVSQTPFPTERCPRTRNHMSSSRGESTREWAKTSLEPHSTMNNTCSTCACSERPSTTLRRPKRKSTGTRQSGISTRRKARLPLQSSQSQGKLDRSTFKRHSWRWKKKELTSPHRPPWRSNQLPPNTIGSSAETRVNLSESKENIINKKKYNNLPLNNPIKKSEPQRTQRETINKEALNAGLPKSKGRILDKEALSAAPKRPRPAKERDPNNSQATHTKGRTPTYLQEMNPEPPPEPEIKIINQFNKSLSPNNSPTTRTLHLLPPLARPPSRSLQPVSSPECDQQPAETTNKLNVHAVPLLLRGAQIRPETPHSSPSLPQSAIIMAVEVEEQHITRPFLNQPAVIATCAEYCHIAQPQMHLLKAPCTHHPKAATLSTQAHEYGHGIPPPPPVRQPHGIQVHILNLTAKTHEVPHPRPHNVSAPGEGKIQPVQNLMHNAATWSVPRARKECLLTQIPPPTLRNGHPDITEPSLVDSELTQITIHGPTDHVSSGRLPRQLNQASSDLQYPPLLTTTLNLQMPPEHAPLISARDRHRIPTVPALPNLGTIPCLPRPPLCQQKGSPALMMHIPNSPSNPLHHSVVTDLKTTSTAVRPGQKPRIWETLVNKSLVNPLLKKTFNMPPTENRCLTTTNPKTPHTQRPHTLLTPYGPPNPIQW